MRIERVVADSFAKASEQTRRLYGSDCLVLSTSNVGDVTEILVAVDDPANDEAPPSVRTIPATTKFEETLTAQLESPTKKTIEFKKQPLVEEMVIGHPPASNDADVLGQGQVLVKAIRDELRALERRLAAQHSASVPTALVNLLEEGVSARYADQWLKEGGTPEELAERLTKDLGIESSSQWIENLHAVVAGPVGSGKTTLSMQLARAASASQVVGLKDARVGARERFFMLADRANLDGVWGLAKPPAGIIDSGFTSPVVLEAMDVIHEAQPALICLPAHVGRAAASEWLRLSGPLLGVVITHWNDAEVPLGLLTQLAEAGIPLKGISSSADVTEALKVLKSSEIKALIARKLELVMYTERVCG